MAGIISIVTGFLDIVRNGAKFEQVIVDVGGENFHSPKNFSSIGDDSTPLVDDYAIMLPIRGGGRFALCGYIDPDNARETQPGEKKLYSRDESKNIRAVVWLKNDGRIQINNGSGAIELESNGNCLINGVEIDFAGNITTTGSISAPSIKADNKELAGHIHLAGDPPGDTGPNK